jgi:hypothetical protein
MNTVQTPEPISSMVAQACAAKVVDEKVLIIRHQRPCARESRLQNLCELRAPAVRRKLWN